MSDELSMSMFASKEDYWKARCEAAEEDAERLRFYVCDELGIDEIAGWDLHCEACDRAMQNGRDEATKDDYVAVLRAVIDSIRRSGNVR